MSNHAADTASTTKKFLAAGGLAFSLAGFGLFAGVGTAVADGTAQAACWGGIPPPSDTAAGAFEAANSAATFYAALPNPEEAGCHYSRAASSYPAGASYGPNGGTSSSWAGSSFENGWPSMH
jgi:hypothetical protein